MVLAKHSLDDTLREMLRNENTIGHITHSLLSIRNNEDQTLMTILELNRKCMSESLSVLLKLEYACHGTDLTPAEVCLSEQLETSLFTFDIIKQLHELQPVTWSEKLQTWITLFIPFLILNLGLTVQDWIFDGYLAHQYWQQWTNETLSQNTSFICAASTFSYVDHWMSDRTLKETKMVNCTITIDYTAKSSCVYNPDGPFNPCYDPNDSLKPYKNCLSAENKFWYTFIPIVGPVVLYMTEFFVLSDAFEPTGIRKRIIDTWKLMMGYVGTDMNSIDDEKGHGVVKMVAGKRTTCLKRRTRILMFFCLILLVLLDTLAIIFWLPVTATCKFVADAKYYTRTGGKKVRMRRNKRCMDLAASRDELMEVSIEDVFETMIQGYIIFPSIIQLAER